MGKLQPEHGQGKRTLGISFVSVGHNDKVHTVIEGFFCSRTRHVVVLKGIRNPYSFFASGFCQSNTYGSPNMDHNNSFVFANCYMYRLRIGLGDYRDVSCLGLGPLKARRRELTSSTRRPRNPSRISMRDCHHDGLHES